ncbi:hypothetical protein NEIELOOT_01628 [Neisseria elongata subsp. glycolytica ATCC 29315]|uniref:Uncharacterized protein n=1 Tax=Neisseria elongata subsp. glycolytica ATCC 29315 TaxID=546263 RepID=D4DRD5_NEIEG|nr:hypothetical protein NEIELOOT_01628 [Neisseria elongata subsp. glycolytica ATCC 29315]
MANKNIAVAVAYHSRRFKFRFFQGWYFAGYADGGDNRCRYEINAVVFT